MRHFKSGLAPLIALLALAIACAPAPPPAEEAAPGTHADLLQLFEEFRVFQEPEIVDGVPRLHRRGDGSAAAGTRGTTRAGSPRSTSRNGRMNGLDFHHRGTV